MISPDNKGVDKLERALTEAYRSKADAGIDSVDATRRVMHDIRQPAGKERWRLSWVVLDELVWRTATIAAALVFIVAVLTVEFVRTPGDENALLLAEDFETAPFFGE